MKTPPPGHGYTPAELLADLIEHTPGVITHFPYVPFPAELVLPAWACHLGEVWAAPRQLSAPSDYDEAYNNLSPPARAEFLAALRRMHRAVWHELINDYTGKSLFGTLSWREDEPAPAYTISELHTLTTRGAAYLLGWLHWRELTPVEQLLTALGTVRIANANLTLKEATHPPCLFVPDCAPDIEAARFAKLFAEFRQHLPGNPSKLTGLANRLAELRALPLAMLREGPARELPTRFPAVKWDGPSKCPADSSEAATFWPDLEQALRTRAEWAARAYDAVANVLNGSIAPPAPAVSALDTPPAPGQSPWGVLLNKVMPLPDFFAFLSECGLLTPAGELTALGRAEGKDKARKAPWAGTLQALIKAGLLDTNAAAVCRALADPAGRVKVSLNEGTLREYSTKAGTYLESANNHLRARGLLR